MKIGFVFDDSLDTTDGIQQYMASLAGWLTQQGHEVHYLVGETKRTDIPHVHSLAKNIAVQFNGNRLSVPLWGSKKRIQALLQRERFDVLHVQVPYHPLLAGRIIAAADPQTTVVGTFHIAPYSVVASAAARLLGMWSRSSLRRFDTMVSVSPAAQSLAKQAFRVDSLVVPNVFDYPRFATAQPLEKRDTKTILFVGRLVPRKGCLILLQAVTLLTQRHMDDFKVVICGDGQLRPQLEAYVTENNLQNIISFAGRISEADKPGYMAMADIAVFPSSAGESFGIVLLEAMASGRAAVLGGDNPGYRSVLGARPQQLFAPRDAVELADKLTELLANEPLRQAAAKWGAAESRQYDVVTVGKTLMGIYQDGGHDSNKAQ